MDKTIQRQHRGTAVHWIQHLYFTSSSSYNYMYLLCLCRKGIKVGHRPIKYFSCSCFLLLHLSLSFSLNRGPKPEIFQDHGLILEWLLLRDQLPWSGENCCYNTHIMMVKYFCESIVFQPMWCISLSLSWQQLPYLHVLLGTLRGNFKRII